MLIMHNSYAKELTQDPPPIICPEKIFCKDTNIKNCQIIGNISQFFTKKLKTVIDIPVSQGDYHFIRAEWNRCTYAHKQYNDRLFIDAKEQVALIPAYNNSQWSGSFPFEKCESLYPKNCPLQSPELLVFQGNLKLLTTIFSTVGEMALWSNDAYKVFRDSSYIYTDYERLIQVCGDIPICKVTFYSTDGLRNLLLGSVKVDLKNKIKIVEIDQNPTSAYLIVKDKKFNAIRFEKKP